MFIWAPFIFLKPICIYMHVKILKLQIYPYVKIISYLLTIILHTSVELKNA